MNEIPDAVPHPAAAKTVTPIERATRKLDDVETWLARWPRPAFIIAATLGAVALGILFFSPLLLNLRHVDRATFQWSRGMGYIDQCADPFRQDVEPALRWRLLPPLVAHALGLRGLWPLVIPWLGALSFVAGCVHWGERWLKSRTSAFALATLVATTSAVLVPLHWMGVNDGWVWLGLFAVVFSRNPLVGAAACLLCPWVDERFIIGLPLAVWSRHRLGETTSLFREMLVAALWLVPYAALRGYMSLNGGDDTSAAFVHKMVNELRSVLPWAPLGWWMGLRAVWIFGAVALVAARREQRVLMEILVVIATIAVTTFTAHDLSRSIAIVLPWIAVGAVVLHRIHADRAGLVLIGVALVNFVIPAAHVVFSKVVAISPLPFELYRLVN